MITQTKLNRFNDHVLVKYQIYNSIFTTLPFDKIKQTGVLLPLFEEVCKQGFSEGKNPLEIINVFYSKYTPDLSNTEKRDLLFQFVQYIERQVVLFDAVEEAAFPIINNLDGLGSIRNSKENAIAEGDFLKLQKHLQKAKVRVVLTAHPTQFYPDDVLAIITDLGKAIENEDFVLSKKLLAQLGKTPFFKHKKPTPYDEAVSLIWYLENIFYEAMSDIYQYISETIFQGKAPDNSILEIGFWPGGDRDGNPFVTTEMTLKVAERLRHSLMKNYYRDIRKLKRRLTFKEVKKTMKVLEKEFYKASLSPKKTIDYTPTSLLKTLLDVKKIVTDKHQSLFTEEIDDLIYKVKLFGFHFSTLDIRQDSRVHEKVFNTIVTTFPSLFPSDYFELSEKEKFESIATLNTTVNIAECKDEIAKKTLESMQAIQMIQKKNGEKGANRYVISNTQNSLHIMQAFTMLKLSGFKDKMPVDVVPLFETVTDLKNAHLVMEKLYKNKAYSKHLQERANKQPIMLGFSDGTKDGGYLMANWGIYQAKENLTKIARKYDIKVIFFDGRGGPPARGGGKTRQFYASLGNTIEHDEIQMTVQGQTISTHYGSLASAQYNLEQLLSANIENALSNTDNELSIENRQVMNDLANWSYDAYVSFKKHPQFLPYLENMSTLQYYGKTNIGSRPSKRNKSDELVFSDLRAIPFVGSWSQLKQNVPGFYGVGTALKKYEDSGSFEKIKTLYSESDFFKALVENSMMSLNKSFFELTSYMKEDNVFGEFWQLIYSEYQTSKRLLLKLTGQTELMENYPASSASIATREDIVLPLLTIQQYALQQIQKLNKEKTIDVDLLNVYEKLVVRSLYGNINASRNSA
ncbi:MAG TPA: phosphoenolpyruvate carboxylase [Lutibacter sp.]|nr:phosphoenolpyruvate carboxylase [Lutibacter sp.]